MLDRSAQNGLHVCMGVLFQMFFNLCMSCVSQMFLQYDIHFWHSKIYPTLALAFFWHSIPPKKHTALRKPRKNPSFEHLLGQINSKGLVSLSRNASCCRMRGLFGSSSCFSGSDQDSSGVSIRCSIPEYDMAPLLAWTYFF